MKHLELMEVGDLLAQASRSAELWSTESLLRAYLIAWLFWLGVSLGAQALLWLRELTGGAWADAIHPECVAAAQLLPVAALGSIPLLMNLPVIYPWCQSEHVDAILERKLAYLNPTWFVIRTITYFSVWLLAALWTSRLRARTQAQPSERNQRHLRRACALALLAYGVGMTFAAIDWGMSLEPHWFSSSYGLAYIFGQALAAMSFAVAVGAQRVAATYDPPALGDLGNLLLALVMLWTYISITEFIIIWFGDLPEENIWYLRRADQGYLWMAAALAVAHFGLPFLLLLRREFKRDPRTIAGIALALLAGRWIDLEWRLAAPFGPFSAAKMLVDAGALLVLGIVWWLLFNWRLRGLLRSEATLGKAVYP